MNTLWLKIAGGAVAVVALIIVIAVLSSSKPQTQPTQELQGFSHQVEKDRKKFLTRPEPVNSAQQTTQDPNQPATTIVQPPQRTQPVTLYFAELSEIDQIEAERLLNVAVPGRSIARLPMTGAKLMVDNCRQLIRRWPESWYAYQAKRMLADMPQHYWPRYKVTPQEVDTSKFTIPRPGTKPFTIKEPD